MATKPHPCRWRLLWWPRPLCKHGRALGRRRRPGSTDCLDSTSLAGTRTCRGTPLLRLRKRPTVPSESSLCYSENKCSIGGISVHQLLDRNREGLSGKECRRQIGRGIIIMRIHHPPIISLYVFTLAAAVQDVRRLGSPEIFCELLRQGRLSRPRVFLGADALPLHLQLVVTYSHGGPVRGASTLLQSETGPANSAMA